jgi:charged multivesicular body protein 5
VLVQYRDFLWLEIFNYSQWWDRSLLKGLYVIYFLHKMNRIFGQKSQKPKPTIEDAIKKGDERVDSIQVKIRKLDAELLKIKEQMNRATGSGKNTLKQKALRILKQKKLYEQQQDQMQNQVFGMEQASMTTENLKNTLVTFDAMKLANKELKKQYKAINIDKIEKVQDEMEDLLEMANEVQETLGRNYDVDVDEDELNAGIIRLIRIGRVG